MDRPPPPFNWSTTVFVILVVQVIILGILVSSLLSVTPVSMGAIGQLPPINFIYSLSDTGWIISGRTAGHIITGIMNLIVGIAAIRHCAVLQSRALKFVFCSIGAQLIATAAVSASSIGIIMYGGWWHVAGFIAGIMSAIAATATAVIVLMVQPTAGPSHEVS
jgi:hypothetical protein